MFRVIFKNQQGQLRNGWWIAVFFAFLAILLLPLIIYAKETGMELTPWMQAIPVILASLLCQRLRQRPQAELFGVFDRLWFRQFVMGIGLGFALMLLPAALLWAFGAVTFQLGSFNSAELVAAVVLFVGVAVTEELTFRGFMFQRLVDGIGSWPAQGVMAAYFVLTHAAALEQGGSWNYLAMVNIFIASLLFGLAYLRTRSLAMPIGLHFMANFTQGTVFGFGVSGSGQQGLLVPTIADTLPNWLSGGSFGLEASLPGLLTLLLLTVGLCRWQGHVRAK